jgi:ribosome-associated translation inhibitor RaiA/cold shock CspA family protein
MQIPPEISFHHIQKQEWARELVLASIEKLEQIYDRLITCRVRVDQRADNSNHTIPPVVRIEMSVPGRKNLVVMHEPDHLQRKYQSPDLVNAIDEAFRIAQEQLAEFKAQLDDHHAVARHEAANEFLGQVAEMHPEQDHGFLMTKEGGLLYFHRNSMLSGDFESLRRGQDVSYVEDVGDTGPIATKVRVKE